MGFPEHLIGSCDIYVDTAFVERRRCWLDWSAGQFVVETSVTQRATSEPQLDASNFSFRNLVFTSQTGELTADELPISFATRIPSLGGMSVEDCLIGRHLEFLQLSPRWFFVCNAPVALQSNEDAREILLRPGGKKSLRWTELICGALVQGTDFGICVRNHKTFEEANIQALSLAVGCPLNEFVRQEGQALRIQLNHTDLPGDQRPLFEHSQNGFSKIEKWWEGVAEVYRAALTFQQEQKDGGKQFRLAIQAFLEARSYPAGFALKVLAAMQFLEWLDERRTIEFGQLAKHLKIPRDVAEVIKDLRNAFSHNHNQGTLVQAADSAGEKLEEIGVWQATTDESVRHEKLLNFVMSLVGKLLLERIGASVEPVNFIPGFGVFNLEGTTDVH